MFTKQGWAYVVAERLHWRADVESDGGGGYLAVSPYTHENFAMTAAHARVPFRPSLVVLQGSTNDVTGNQYNLKHAFAETVATVRSRFPGSQIVVLGPITPTAGLMNQVEETDSRLHGEAVTLGVPYLSATDRLSAHSYDDTWFNLKAAGHPNAAGYAEIARRFIAALHALGA